MSQPGLHLRLLATPESPMRSVPKSSQSPTEVEAVSGPAHLNLTVTTQPAPEIFSSRRPARRRCARVNWIKIAMVEMRDSDGHTLWCGKSFAEPGGRAARCHDAQDLARIAARAGRSRGAGTRSDRGTAGSPDRDIPRARRPLRVRRECRHASQSWGLREFRAADANGNESRFGQTFE